MYYTHSHVMLVKTVAAYDEFENFTTWRGSVAKILTYQSRDGLVTAAIEEAADQKV